MKPFAFKIDGMDCAEEVLVLKREIGPLVGDEGHLDFDILRGKMTVCEPPVSLTEQRIIDAVNRTGMRAAPWVEQAPDQRGGANWRGIARTVLTALSGCFTAAGFVWHAVVAGGVLPAFGAEGLGGMHEVPPGPAVLYAMAVVAGLWLVLPKAYHAARRRRPDMNLLMTIAVAGAIGIGEWFEAATVSFLFAVSLLLESWSVGRARRAVETLLDLAPPVARLKEEDGHREVLPDEVAVGSHIIVKAAERIPLDGRVVRGSSEVNQAPITGESMPVRKQSGDEVFAGTINGDATLEIETTKPAGDTTLAHIIRLVSEAQSRRSPSEQWVEKFARWYTPAVIVAAVLIFIVPPLAFSQSWADWFYRSLVLLVIACPCALVISTPVSIVAALAASARNGVLVKGGVYMEAPAHVRTIAFDKTGTITLGQATVQQVVPLSGHDERELLQRAAAMETHSNHPLARAIVEYARLEGINFEPAEDFEVIQGKGATARFDGRDFWLGSHRYLEERGQETPEMHERLVRMADAGHSVVVIGTNDHVCGLIGIADAIRPDAKASIASLRQAGVKHLVMLTGDNAGTASAIAAEMGIDDVRAELLPQDKVDAVERLVTEHGHVAMVGDGVNDAPSLARATLGIAMGAAGSDAAIEAADIALMSDDLSKLPWLIRHSRRTLAIIRQNIAFSLLVKAAFVVLTLVGYASLWAAIAADVGASLLVVFNGLRLLRPRGGSKQKRDGTSYRTVASTTAILFTLCVAGGCAVAEPVAVHTPDGQAHQRGSVHIAPLRFVRGVPLVEVNINGTTGHLFVFDTGHGDVSIVSPELVDELRIESTMVRGRLRGSTGHVVRVGKAVTIESLRIGTMDATGLDAVVFDLSSLSQVLGQKIDGIIGLTPFKHHLVTLDYLTSELRFEAGTLPPEDGREVLKAIYEQGRPFVSLRVEGTTVSVNIDSGNTWGLSLRPEDVRGWHFAESLVTGPKIVSAGGTTRGRLGRLTNDVWLGGAQFSQPIVEIAPVRHNLLGADVLRHFRITFSISQGLVKFVRDDHGPIQMPSYRHPGFGVMSRDSGWVIADIIPGTPAASRDVRLLDRVVSVDGTPTEGLPAHALHDMIRHREAITLTLERNENIRIVRIPIATFVR